MRAIIIAVQAAQRRFACETEDGLCAVFSQLSGPTVETGEILSGEVLSLGAQTLEFGGEVCLVTGENAMICRADALALLEKTRAGAPAD